MTRLCSFLALILSLSPQGVSSFLVGSKTRSSASPPPLQRGVRVSVRSSPLGSTGRTTPESLEDLSLQENKGYLESTKRKTNPSPHVVFSTAVLCSLLLVGSPASSPAYEYTDYASETVLAAVQSLKDAAGNSEQTFKSYENIADIITEGKGVGGTINYKGVQLDRGYISDEDTSIYNPGLTLLTESEKERLTSAIIASKKAAVNENQWSENNKFAFEFLRDKLDPFHTYELRGYLAVLPTLALVVYLGVLAVQQTARNLYPAAYFGGIAILVLPAIVLIALGPQ